MRSLDNRQLRCAPLIEKVLDMDFRDIITRQEISSLVGEPVGTRKFYDLVGNARHKLEEHGRVLRLLKGQGYILLHPDDCAEEAVAHYKRGGRAISRGERILEYALVDDMTPEARERYREVYKRARTLHAGVKGAIVELNLLNRPHPLAVSQ